MKKWIIVLLIIIVCAGVWFWWKSDRSDSVKKEVADKLKPTIDVANVHFTDFDADHIKINSKVVLHNPYPVEITTKKLDFEVFIDTVNVIRDAYSQPIMIKSRDSTVITIPMELLAKKTAAIVRRLEKENIDSVEYSARATFDADVPIAGQRTFNFHVSKKGPAIRVPEFNVKDVDLNAFKLRKKGVDLVLEIINKGPLNVEIRNGKFAVKAGDHLEMKGDMQDVVKIPPRGREDISMNAVMTDGNAMKAIWQMLTDKEDAHITVRFTGSLASEDKVLDGSKVNIKLDGTLAELQKTAKDLKAAAGESERRKR